MTETSPSALPSVRSLGTALAQGEVSPTQLAASSLRHSNLNASRNTYLWQNTAWTLAEAAHSQATPKTALRGIPVSVKDCFDLAGSPTSCGTRFHAETGGIAERDSWLVEQLRSAGAVITGKTHLHPLAYGITGENPDYGDCLQPLDSTALTGGSSSGAAASIQEGSAALAIGTDTGGSIRVPAALCGLVGYRASLGRGSWRGGAHLAPSFDTIGCLFRHLEDAPLFASLFAPSDIPHTTSFMHFATVSEAFLHDCDPTILTSYRSCIRELESLGLTSTPIDFSWWRDSFEIFALIQASEAASLHAGFFQHFEPSIRQRLEWGAHISAVELSSLRGRQMDFNARMNAIFATHQLVLLPAAPVTRLPAGTDHSTTRSRLLRYTTPFSLVGVPVITIPCEAGGMQLAAPLNQDESLLELAAALATHRKLMGSSSDG